MNRSDWANLTSSIIADGLVLHGAGKGIQFVKKGTLPTSLRAHPLFTKAHEAIERSLAQQVEVVTAEGVVIRTAQQSEGATVCAKAAENVREPVKSSVSAEMVKEVEKIAEKNIAKVNQTPTAVLRDGYYEVNGFKFSEYYYNKLWNRGRGAPSLIAQEVLAGAKTAVPDPSKLGFFRYEFGGWEMIYNPETQEVWHLCFK